LHARVEDSAIILNSSNRYDLETTAVDRGEVISELFDRLGSKIESFYHSLGEYDLVIIAEFPDNETMAGIADAVRANESRRTIKSPSC